MKYAHRIIVGKYEGKRLVGGRRPRWDNNVIEVKVCPETGHEGP